MPFIQGNINSNEDLIEAMDAMREMLTQGDYKAELKLELAEVNHKLSGFKGSELGGAQYARYGILHALKDNLEDTLRKLEEVEKEPQEDGYDEDDFYDEDNEEPTQSVDEWDAKKFLEAFSEKAYGSSKPKKVEEKEPVGLTSEEFLEEILEKINARTQVEVDKLRNNPWGF